MDDQLLASDTPPSIAGKQRYLKVFQEALDDIYSAQREGYFQYQIMKDMNAFEKQQRQKKKMIKRIAIVLSAPPLLLVSLGFSLSLFLSMAFLLSGLILASSYLAVGILLAFDQDIDWESKLETRADFRLKHGHPLNGYAWEPTAKSTYLKEGVSDLKNRQEISEAITCLIWDGELRAKFMEIQKLDLSALIALESDVSLYKDVWSLHQNWKDLTEQAVDWKHMNGAERTIFSNKLDGLLTQYRMYEKTSQTDEIMQLAQSQ